MGTLFLTVGITLVYSKICEISVSFLLIQSLSNNYALNYVSGIHKQCSLG